MIVTGLCTTVASGLATWIGFGVSAAFHLSLLAILYLVFPRYARTNSSRRRLFRILQNHVGLLWIAYPVVWVTSPAGFGYVSVAGTAMIVAYLDVVAKTSHGYFIWREQSAFGSGEQLPSDMIDIDPTTDTGDTSPTNS